MSPYWFPMLQSPPPAAIAAEMVEAVEVYMARRLEFVIKFGLVIKSEQLSEENKPSDEYGDIVVGRALITIKGGRPESGLFD